jgi:diguanylate cyclase (GGDEF)-like protein
MERLHNHMTRTPELKASAKQLAPFAAIASAAWISVLIGVHLDWLEYWISVALLFLSWGFGIVAALRGHVTIGIVVGSLLFLVAAEVLRDAAGGSQSGIGILALLPVLQTALYVRDRRALAIVLVGVVIFYLAPIVFIGPPDYIHSGYRSALLATAVSTIIGLVTHGLVEDIREREEEARRRERILVRVNDTVQTLFDSPNARADAVETICEISGATIVVLYEAGPGSEVLRYTAATVADGTVPLHTPAAPDSAAYEAFRSRQPVMINDKPESRAANTAFWLAGGKPASVLYQPLVRGEVSIGVLIVGWAQRTQIDEPDVVLASLLGHQVAAVINRADVIEQLTDEALTDPLTRVANRRAWDAELENALSVTQPVAVAMLDFDHFKEFNDTYGHPAGDRLLQEATEAWRREMRPRDFLARLGGEEFALLLTGIDVRTAERMVERLRSRMPGDQTCSAGVALRLPGDTPSDLLSRADQALYDAKQGGRDRTVTSRDEPVPTA